MQLNKQTIKQLVDKNSASTQMTFDEDYVIKDSKPDVLSIVCATGMPEVEETRCTNNSLWITGHLDFEIMYRQESNANVPEMIKGSIPFQEKMMVEQLSDGDNVKVNCTIEDLSVSIINSRKISIRGILNIDALGTDIESYNIAESLADENCEQFVEEEEFLGLQTAKLDTLRIDNEIVIPKSKPNIGKILYDFIDVRNIETSFSGGQLNVQGEICCLIFYISEERENEWYDTTLSFSGYINCDGDYDPYVYWAKVRLAQKSLEAEQDYDNEMRQVNLQLVFEADICTWKEEKLQVLKDAYSLTENMLIKRNQYCLDRFLIKNVARSRFTEQIHMDVNEDSIMQICGCKSGLTIEQTLLDGNRLNVSGIMTVHMLYIASDDGFPVRCRMDQIPFEQQIELQGVDEKSVYKLDPGVDQLQINLLDNREYEIKAAVHIAAIAFDKKNITVIDEIDIDKSNVSSDDVPGIVGYVIGKDEKLWDIAKQYKTTVDDICLVNSIDKAVSPGDKILIVKSTK